MSLFVFLIGAVFLYYLFVTYYDSQEEQEQKQSPSHQARPNLQTEGPKLTAIFKSFVATLTDPANNNYLDWGSAKPDPFIFRAFVDRFQTFDDVSNAMKAAGLNQCRLILGIDFTASNEWQGRSSNRGFSLHKINSRAVHNPYHHVITVLGHTLKDFVATTKGETRNYKSKSDFGIPAFGFGDSITKDKHVFCLRRDGFPCIDFHDVLMSYRDTVGRVTLGGPTSYAPVINKAIDIVERTKQFHLLVIVADGQFVDEKPTAKAIVAASFYPLSIVVVGVGDGPWTILHQFDDWLPQRQFDNFQFVEYDSIVKKSNAKNVETALALQILMEVPDQYKIVQQLGFLTSAKENPTIVAK